METLKFNYGLTYDRKLSKLDDDFYMCILECLTKRLMDKANHQTKCLNKRMFHKVNLNEFGSLSLTTHKILSLVIKQTKSRQDCLLDIKRLMP
ncbi:hypothetical protein CR513_58369, partial [Mucuna pruriens]